MRKTAQEELFVAPGSGTHQLGQRPPRSTSQHPMRRNSERTLETDFVVDGGMRATMRCVDESLLVSHDQSHGALLLDGREPPPTARFSQEEHQSSRKPLASCGDLRELGMVEPGSDIRLLWRAHRGTMRQTKNRTKELLRAFRSALLLYTQCVPDLKSVTRLH